MFPGRFIGSLRTFKFAAVLKRSVDLKKPIYLLAIDKWVILSTKIYILIISKSSVICSTLRLAGKIFERNIFLMTRDLEPALREIAWLEKYGKTS